MRFYANMKGVVTEIQDCCKEIQEHPSEIHEIKIRKL